MGRIVLLGCRSWVIGLLCVLLSNTVYAQVRSGVSFDVPAAYHQVSAFGEAGEVKQVVVMTQMACVLLSTQQVRCWDHETQGTIGLSNSRAVSFASAAKPKAIYAKTGEAGYFETGFHACAVLDDGAVQCWGRLTEETVWDADALFDLSAAPASHNSLFAVPLKPPYAERFKGATALFTQHSILCGTVNNSLYCPHELMAYLNTQQNVRSAIFGEFLTCWILHSGERQCVISGGDGRLIDLTLGERRLISAQVMQYVFQDGVCEISLQGALYCGSGEVDTQALSTGQVRLSGELIALPAKAVTIEMSPTHQCVLLENGQAYCWGMNVSYALGNTAYQNAPGSSHIQSMPAPGQRIAFDNGRRIDSIALGSAYSCFLLNDGVLECLGQLGPAEIEAQN